MSEALLLDTFISGMCPTLVKRPISNLLFIKSHNLMDLYVHLMIKTTYVNAQNVVQVKGKKIQEKQDLREPVYFIKMIHKMENQMSLRRKSISLSLHAQMFMQFFAILEAGIIQTSSLLYPYIIPPATALLLQYRTNENLTM